MKPYGVIDSSIQIPKALFLFQVKTFVSKMLDDGKTKQEVTRHLTNVHDNVRSYVSKYRTATSETEPRQATHRQPNYERNVHYFCTARHGVQVNAHYLFLHFLRYEIKSIWLRQLVIFHDDMEHYR